AAASLAGLLNQPGGDEVRIGLTAWLANQTMEALVCVGLLPFVLARDQAPQLSIDTSNILQAIKAPSLLSHLPLGDLGVPRTLLPPPGGSDSERAPTSFHPSPFFKEHVKAFIPGIHWFWAEILERDAFIALPLQWAYEWQLMAKRENVELSD